MQPCPSGGDCIFGCYDLHTKYPRIPCAPVKEPLVMRDATTEEWK